MWASSTISGIRICLMDSSRFSSKFLVGETGWPESKLSGEWQWSESESEFSDFSERIDKRAASSGWLPLKGNVSSSTTKTGNCFELIWSSNEILSGPDLSLEFLRSLLIINYSSQKIAFN